MYNKIKTTSGAKTLPKPYIENTKTNFLPLLCGWASSEAIDDESGYSPPIPRPRMNLIIERTMYGPDPSEMSNEKAWRTEKMMRMIIVQMYMSFLPIASAKTPKRSCPQAIPMRTVDERVEA